MGESSEAGTVSTKALGLHPGKIEARRFMAKNGGAREPFITRLRPRFEDLYSDLKLFMEESGELA